MTTAILLAAGASTRFGADKLAAKIGDRTVLEMSAGAIRGSRCDRRIAVVSAMTHSQAPALSALGFEIFVNDAPERGVSASLRIGVEAAAAQGACRVLIALGDMPFVTSAHLDRLLEHAAAHETGLAFTEFAGRRSPPAVFDQKWFARLRALQGDVGARDLLRSASDLLAVAASPEAGRDIDRRTDLPDATSG